MKSIIEYLENSAKTSSEAVCFYDGSEKLTFSLLRKRAIDVARTIIAVTNNCHNKPVAVLLPRSCKSVIAFMGTLYSGNFYAPVDVKNPSSRIQKIFDDLAPEVIITNNDGLKIIEECGHLGKTKIINLDDLKEDENNDKAPLLKVQTIDSDPVYCIYTSGSTGSPKGVIISHRNLKQYVESISHTFSFDHRTRFANQVQFHFDVSVIDIYATLRNASFTYIIPDSVLAKPLDLMQSMSEQKVNSIYWVPSIMNFIAGTNTLSSAALPPLGKILFAGEVMPIKTLNYWREHFKDSLFANLYGPTEITVTCTHYIVDRDFSDGDVLPIGKPSDNYDVFLLNDRNERVSKSDEVGEICVRSSSLSMGYWNNPEKSREVFVQNPLNRSYQELIYRTGDLAKLNDKDEIIYLGRKDHQIKHMGHRIELGEIEKSILQHSEVVNAIVFYDELKKLIVACYESRAGQELGGELFKFLMKHLPKYMIPGKMIRYDSLPISSTGKVDREQIKKSYQMGQ